MWCLVVLLHLVSLSDVLFMAVGRLLFEHLTVSTKKLEHTIFAMRFVLKYTKAIDRILLWIMVNKVKKKKVVRRKDTF